jgi:hypothetical protein
MEAIVERSKTEIGTGLGDKFSITFGNHKNEL